MRGSRAAVRGYHRACATGECRALPKTRQKRHAAASDSAGHGIKRNRLRGHPTKGAGPPDTPCGAAPAVTGTLRRGSGAGGAVMLCLLIAGRGVAGRSGVHSTPPQQLVDYLQLPGDVAADRHACVVRGGADRL